MVSDPGALSKVITELGGTVIDNTWRFDLPLSQVKDVIPRLNQLGVGVRKVRERTEQGPKTQTVATLELYRPEENQRSWQIPNW
jgi:hypothetical protein